MKSYLVDYTTLHEKFTDYECDNGLILRHKPVLAAVHVTNDFPSALDIKQTYTTIVNKKKPHAKQTLLINEHEKKGRNLKWKPVKPTINIYETDTHILFMHSVITKIFLTEKVDENGHPKLGYTSKNIINVIAKDVFTKEKINTDIQKKLPKIMDIDSQKIMDA